MATLAPQPTAFDDLLARPTPLLALGRVRVKLESLRATGGVDDRALGLWTRALRAARALGWRGDRAVFAGSAGAALAGAAWAAARGLRLTAALHGPLLHEARETLALWAAEVEECASEEEASARAAGLAGDPAWGGALLLPPLDGPEAAAELAATLGQELLRDLSVAGEPTTLLVAPAGARAALAGARDALAASCPALRTVALLAAREADALPDLPFSAALPDGLEVARVTRAQAQAARLRLSCTLGLLASHASAAAIAFAEQAGGTALALCVASGEREFSLDPAMGEVRA